VGELADRLGRDAGLALGVLERVGLDLGAVFLEALGRVGDEGLVLQARGDDLPADRIRERDVAADVEAEPEVGELGGAGPPRVDGDQPRAVADAAQQVVEEDRVRLAGVGAPQDDEVGLLSLLVGRGPSPGSERCRQTDD